MARPKLTFFTELQGENLPALFDQIDLTKLSGMNASISMGLLDFRPERAQVVRQLNDAGIPVIAWLLLPKEEGYWFNMDNWSQAATVYEQFKSWTQQEGLRWERIGVDMEPDIREMEMLGAGNWTSLIPKIIKRVVNNNTLRRAHRAYASLVDQIRADGYAVTSYIFPFLADERQMGSSLFRRLSGIVDVPADREVWMLYTSPLRPFGVGMLGSYGPEAPSIGIGVTGGGVDSTVGNRQPLEWQEFARDLRLAWSWTDDIHIFSLEGCVLQDFLPRLSNFAWDQPLLLPNLRIAQVERSRSAFRSILWVSANMSVLIAGFLGISLGYIGIRRLVRRKQKAV